MNAADDFFDLVNGEAFLPGCAVGNALQHRRTRQHLLAQVGDLGAAALDCRRVALHILYGATAR